MSTAGENMKCVFYYPRHFVLMPEYTAHTGETVTVIRETDRSMYDYEGERLFDVVCDDGVELRAWESELTPIPPMIIEVNNHEST